MSQEDLMINRIHNERRTQAKSKSMERASQLSRSILKEAELAKKVAIKPETFRDLYKSGVDQDNGEVLEILRKIKEDHRFDSPEAERSRREMSGIASALEFLIYDGIQTHSWFGPQARAVKTAPYDDIVNGVDLVAEFRKSNNELESHLGLAIDVSFAVSVDKKLARIKEDIDRGKLSRVKYFESDVFRGELRGIPRVVAGLDSQSTLNLAQLWESQKNRFTSHSVQHTLLQEILLQLETFRRYAAGTGKNDLLPAYDRALRVIEMVVRQKGERSEFSVATETVSRLKGSLERIFNAK